MTYKRDTPEVWPLELDLEWPWELDVEWPPLLEWPDVTDSDTLKGLDNI
jgi:hypothetical protein